MHKIINARYFLLGSIFLFSLTVAFSSGYLFGSRTGNSDQFPLLIQAYEIIRDHGLKEIPPKPIMEYGMIRGMLQAYQEPYTIFIEPPQHELESNVLEGKFGGIGVELAKDADRGWILYPYQNSPAEIAGIQDGDQLISIEDMMINPLTPLDIIESAIRGPIGERVKLIIGRYPEYKPFEVSIKREEISLPSITWRIIPNESNIGIVKINLISSNTPQEIRYASKDLMTSGVTHFILDLRDTPGGLLLEGIDLTRLFLRDGIVIQQQYKGLEIETFYVEKEGEFVDIPMIVLINQGSASAAEIIAGSLQYHNRALLIGSPTYGKNTIQLIFELSDNSSLHVTAAKWWFPDKGNLLDENAGIQPDILLENPIQGDQSDPILERAILLLKDSNHD